MRWTLREVCFGVAYGLVHRSKHDALLDHLVGADEQRGRHIEVKHLCGFEVKPHYIAIGLLDWKVRWRSVVSDFVDVIRCLFGHPNSIWAEADQSSCNYGLSERVAGWQLI